MNLEGLKKKFEAFRATQPGVTGRSLRYPQPLQELAVRAKDSGVTYTQLAEVTGMSEGGLTKMVDRHHKKDGGAAPAATKSTASKAAAKTTTAKGPTAKKVAKMAAQAAEAPKKRGRPKKLPEVVVAMPKKAAPKAKTASKAAPKAVKTTKVAAKTLRKAAKPAAKAIASRKFNQTKAASTLKKAAVAGSEITFKVKSESGEIFTVLVEPREMLKVFAALAAK